MTDKVCSCERLLLGEYEGKMVNFLPNGTLWDYPYIPIFENRLNEPKFGTNVADGFLSNKTSCNKKDLMQNSQIDR